VETRLRMTFHRRPKSVDAGLAYGLYRLFTRSLSVTYSTAAAAVAACGAE